MIRCRRPYCIRASGAILAASVFVAGLAGVALFAQSPATDQERDQRLTEEVTVFEAQTSVDPTGLGPIDKQRLRADQVLLLEGGVPRKVTSLEPLGMGGWKILVYFDAPTSRNRTVKLAAQRLGGLARALTDLGEVEVVVADPEPHTVAGPGREASPLADRLAGIGKSGLGSDRIKELRDAFTTIEPGLAASDPRRREALQKETELVRASVDRIVLTASKGCDGQPCALFVVTDGFYEDAATFYLGEQRLTGAGADPFEEAAQQLAQTVTAYEWIAFPLPLREGSIEPPVVAKPRTDFDVFLDHTGAVRPAPKKSDREPTVNWDKLEVSVTPVLRPLVELAAASGGDVVRLADNLGAPLEKLPSRRRVYYLTDRPLDGEPRSLAARMVQSGSTLPSPQWIRSSTPPAVGAARARAALEGRKLDSSVPVTARLERDASGGSVLVVEARWEGAALPPSSSIRISVAYPRPGGLPWVGHQRVKVGESAAGATWTHRLPLELPSAPGKVAVVAEGLVARVWGATVIEP